MSDMAGIQTWLNNHPQPPPTWDDREQEQMAALSEGRIVRINGRPRQLEPHGEWGPS